MPRWTLSIPRPATYRTLSSWTKHLLSQAVPREIISFHLLSIHGADLSLEELEATARIENEVASIMLQRNLRGIELEKSGQLEDAIALYEANVADWFGGNHPYDRLRIIYSKSGRYQEALRVCQAFVTMADELLALGSPRGDLRPKRDKFAESAAKLQGKSG